MKKKKNILIKPLIEDNFYIPKIISHYINYIKDYFIN